MGQKASAKAKIKRAAVAFSALTACLIVAPALTACNIACGKQADNAPASAAAGSFNVSICTILLNPKFYVGKIVKIKAIYQTDNLTYSAFEDVGKIKPKCKYNNVIGIGYLSKMNDKSVRNFFNKSNKLCAKKNDIVCHQSAYVTFLGHLVDGKKTYYIHIDKIIGYKFIESRK